MEELEGAEAIINFAGRTVNCLYTAKNRKEIINSRLDSVQVLHRALRQCQQPPKVFIQAGSLAIFGDTREECDEEAPHGEGFSVEVCQRWEEAFFAVDHPETRQVVLRIGFVLGRDGGALEPLQKLARFGLGGKIGSGKQYISWIHIEDLNRMIRYGMDRPLEGVYNATGPTPVTNDTFMATLRKAMGKGWAPPAPTPLVKLGAVPRDAGRSQSRPHGSQLYPQTYSGRWLPVPPHRFGRDFAGIGVSRGESGF